MHPKKTNVLEIVRQCFALGRYVYSKHALIRQKERGISDGDVRCAALNGWHEKKKDAWDIQYESWNYSIRGSSLDGERLRIPVNLDEFDSLGTIIITVINLDRD